MVYYVLRAFVVISALCMTACGQENISPQKQVEVQQAPQTQVAAAEISKPTTPSSTVTAKDVTQPTSVEQKTTVHAVDAAVDKGVSAHVAQQVAATQQASPVPAPDKTVAAQKSDAEKKEASTQVAAAVVSSQEQAQPVVQQLQQSAPAEQKEQEETEASPEVAHSAQPSQEQVSNAQVAQPAEQKNVQPEQNQPTESQAVTSEQTEAMPPAQEAQAQQPSQEPVKAEEQKSISLTPANALTATQSAVKEQQLIEPEGIDTLDIEGGGNWLLKRGWWEQAERKYEKTKALLDKILEARMPFLDKRAEVDRTIFDPFYAQVGLDQGRIEETLSFLNDEINQDKEKEGTLKEEERALLNSLIAEKSTLEQLSLDVQAINKLDNQIDAVISKLMEQINRARGYEQQSWKAFKDIARELSDEKAREHASAMDTHFANLEALYHYITVDLAQFYAKLIQDGVQQIDTVKGQLQALKEKGIDLKSQAERIQRQEMQTEKQQSEEEKEEEIKKALAKAKAEQQGIFGKIWSYITGFFGGIAAFFGNIFSWIMGFFGKK